MSDKPKNWIQGAVKHPGAMTKSAKREGVSNSKFEQEHKHDSGVSGKKSTLCHNYGKFEKKIMKTCNLCKITKSFDNFYPTKSGKNGYSGSCRSCDSNRKKEYYKNNSKYIIAKTSIWSKQNPERFKKSSRNSELKRKYNITLENYNELFNSQNGRCAICDIHQSVVKKTLSVDHCHKTGQVRSLLCSNCNIAIGLLKDKPELMIKAAEYINKFTKKVIYGI